jgi:small-conductance mechanosensitive channel
MTIMPAAIAMKYLLLMTEALLLSTSDTSTPFSLMPPLAAWVVFLNSRDRFLMTRVIEVVQGIAASARIVSLMRHSCQKKTEKTLSEWGAPVLRYIIWTLLFRLLTCASLDCYEMRASLQQLL